MALTMARPFRDKTGAFYLRQRTPRDLVRRVIGKSVTLPVGDAFAAVKIGDMVQVSLRTRDAAVAKTRHAAAAATLHRVWDGHRGGPQRLSLKQATALAGRHYHAVAVAFEDGPQDDLGVVRRVVSDFTAKIRHSGKVGANLINDLKVLAREEGLAWSTEFGDHGPQAAMLLRAKINPVSGAEELLAREGLVVDRESRALLVEEVKHATDDVLRRLVRATQGDFRADPAADRFPEWQAPGIGTARLTLVGLFERWEKHPENANISTSTRKAYRSVFNALSHFLEKPEATSVTTNDLNRYFDARMTGGEGTRKLSPRVVRDVHKAALGSVFGWALGKGMVEHNPAAAVRIKVIRAAKLRSKAATDAEARAFAAAALAISPEAGPRTIDAAQRWCPLLLLYTGCRIGELTQLRGRDVQKGERGQVTLRVTPEAGKVKARQVRFVPVHPRLVKLGFMDFVRAAGEGPLFFDPKDRRRADAQTPQAQLIAEKLARWSRTVGLGDPQLLRPLHALRHRFMTVARLAGIEEQYTEAIAGHSPGKQNRDYGEFPLAVLHGEIRKLEPVAVEGRAPRR